MRALSLSRPWPWAILNAGKRIENRKRKDGRMPAICNHRGPLLLHAAQSWDDKACDWIAARFPELRLQMPTPTELRHATDVYPAGVIFASCTAVGHIEPWECDTCGDWEPHLRVNCTDCEGTLNADDSPDLRWWMGGYALVLADVQPTPFVRCRGMLGLWTPTPDVLAKLGLP